MVKQTRLSVLVVIFTVLAMAGIATAGTLNDLIAWPPDTVVFGSDENVERLVNRVGSPDIIDIGDSIYGLLVIEQMNLLRGGVPSEIRLTHNDGNSEFTAEFQILVVGKVPTGNPISPFAFTFAPDPAFDTNNVGTMIRMYEDFEPPGDSSHFDIHDFTDLLGETPGPDMPDAITSVTDGAFYWALGLVSAGNAWIGTGFDDLSLPIGPSDRLGDVVFAPDRPTELGAAAGSVHSMLALTNALGMSGEFIGTSQIGGPIAGSPWPLSSHSNVDLVVIPLPAAVWAGMGMMGLLGAARIWRRRTA